MRIRLVLLGAATLVLAAAPAAHAAQAVSCSAPSATVLFWPKGHAAVPTVGFPKILTPHLEVYGAGAGYPSANFLLYADASRSTDASRSCGSGAVAKTSAVGHARTIKSAKAVTCTAGAALVYDIKRAKRGLTIIGHAGTRAYFRAEIHAKGSTLSYDRTACNVAAAPH